MGYGNFRGYVHVSILAYYTTFVNLFELISDVRNRGNDTCHSDDEPSYPNHPFLYFFGDIYSVYGGVYLLLQTVYLCFYPSLIVFHLGEDF